MPDHLFHYSRKNLLGLATLFFEAHTSFIPSNQLCKVFSY